MIPLEPGQWQELKTLLDQAADLPQAEQRTYIEKHLSHDPKLHTLALELLQANPPKQRLQMGMRLGWKNDDLGCDNRVGSQLGPYFLKRKLGSGGMGNVYLAERHLDGAVQKVAVKVLKRGLDSEAILRRFSDERRILAKLDHPHIATFLDSGTTPDHLPYLVMTFTEGQSLFNFCRSNKLGLRDRLLLFRKICLAVHFAHQNLVVHRDLKPSNLLITNNGEPCLLDFGISKWLLPDDSEATGLTKEGQRVLTPNYASPEQFRGGPITTASDTYSLGILFYELIAGVSPFQRPRLHSAGIEVDAWQSWSKPSARLLKSMVAGFRNAPPLADHFAQEPLQKARHRVSQLRGDLDTMARKAMQYLPEARYGSALQFAEDIERYLDGKPISARRETFSYVFSKWLGRHKLAVGFSVALTLMATSFGLYSAKKQRDLVAHMRIAASAEEKSQHLTRFMSQTFAAAEPFEGDICDITATMLVQQAAKRLLEEEHIEPKVKASLIGSIAQIYQEPDLLANAEEMLFRELEKQTNLRTGQQAAQGEHILSHFQLKKGHLQKAAHHLERARRAYQQHADTSFNHRADVASALGEIYRLEGNHQAAKAQQFQALRLSEQSQEPRPSERAKILKRLAAAHKRTGEPEKAAEMLKLAIKSLGHSESYAVARAEIETDLGLVFHRLGLLAQAEALFKKGIARRIQIFGAQSPWTAKLFNQLAWVHVTQGAFEESEKAFAICYQIRKGQLPEDHEDVFSAQKNLASNLLMNGKFSKAATMLDDLLAGPTLNGWDLCDPRRATFHLLQAKAQLGLNHGSNAATHLELAETLFGSHKSNAASMGDLKLSQGELAMNQRQLRQAQTYFQEALIIAEIAYGPMHYLVGKAYLKLGSLYRDRGDLGSARANTHQALHVFTADPDRFGAFMGEGLAILADLGGNQPGQTTTSDLHGEARRLLVRGYGSNSPRVRRIDNPSND